MAITVSCVPVTTAQVNSPYNSSITATGGTAPYTYALVSGGLPPGLTLVASTGAISGTPTTRGSFTFTVQARDATSATGTTGTCGITVSGWLSRNNFTASDFLHADDLNNLANDQRTWGGNVNGGGYILSNVVLASSVLRATVAVTSVFGRTGDVVALASDYTPSFIGAVPTARQVIAGPGMSGGGPLTADVTLSALVPSVFGRTGAITLTPADISNATGVLNTRNVNTGLGLTGGGNLSADRTLAIVPDSVNQQVQVLSAATVVGTRHAINFINGSNVTVGVADNAGSNRIDVTIASTGGGTGGMTDPTQVLGDLIVRSATITTRLPVGSNGQVLVCDSTQPLGIKWAPESGVSVNSVFGRTGTVIAASGDYVAAQVLNAIDATQAYTNPSWIVSLNWNKITAAPAFMLDPTSAKGDLIVHGATTTRLPVGADTTILTADSTQAAGIKWAPVPSSGSPQTPWASDINAAYHNLSNVQGIGLGGTPTAPVPAASPYPLYVVVATTGADASPTTSSVLITDSNTQLQFGVSQRYNAAATPAGAPWLQAFANSTGNPTALVLQPLGVSKNAYLGVGQEQPAYALDVVGDCNITGRFLVNGASAAGSLQTPWLENIDAATYTLSNVSGIGIGTTGVAAAPGLTLQYTNPSITLNSPGVTDKPNIDFIVANTYRWQVGVGLDVQGFFFIKDMNAGTRLSIDESGNVGLGLEPVYALDVIGDINCTGIYRVKGVATGGIVSVFGRTGAVAAATGDYTAAQVINAVSTTGSYSDPPWIASLSWSKIVGAPSAGVSSVFGRTGAVVAATGDYTVAQITNAVANTRQILTGTGLTGGGNLSADRTLSVVADTVNQQVQILNAGTLIGTRHAINLISGANVSISTSDSSTNNRVDVTVSSTGGGGGMVDPTTTLGDLLVRSPTTVQRLGVGLDTQILTADSTSPLGVKWSPPGVSSQTPWLTNENAANFNLDHVANIGVNSASTAASARIYVVTSATEAGVMVVNNVAADYASMNVTNDVANFVRMRSYGSAYTIDPGIGAIEAAMSLKLIANGAEVMRLTTGRVLIGTTTDDGTNMLQVHGTVKSAVGGYVFPDGTTQTTAATPATSAVTSVFGRTGVVIATAGDYTASLVTNAVDSTATYSDPAWLIGLNWSKILSPPAFVPPSRQILTGAGLTGGGSLAADRTLSVVPDSINQQVQVLNAGTLVGTRHAINLIQGSNVTLTIADDTTNNRVNVTVGSTLVGGVTSVFGRTGAVTAQSGDYTASLVTNAVDQTVGYANPSWITSLAYSKITGAPTPSAYQTPWLSNIDGGGFYLSDVNQIGIGMPMGVPACALDVWGPYVASLGVARIKALGTGNSYLGFDTVATGASTGIFFRTAGAWMGEIDCGSYGLQFWTQNSPTAAIVVDSYGNVNLTQKVGIGSVSPNVRLQVNEGTNLNVAYAALSGITTIQATNDAVTSWVPLQHQASAHYFMGGNVGIGTTSPQRILHLSTPGSCEFILADTSQATDAKIWRIYNNATQLNIGTTNDAYTSGANFITVIRSGGVGIGGVVPDAQLSVQAPNTGDTVGSQQLLFDAWSFTSNGQDNRLRLYTNRFSAGTDWSGVALRLQYRVQATDMAYISFNPAPITGTGSIAFGYASTEFMRILNTGAVGIGTTAPVHRLDIQGNLPAGTFLGNFGGTINNTSGINVGILLQPTETSAAGNTFQVFRLGGVMSGAFNEPNCWAITVNSPALGGGATVGSAIGVNIAAQQVTGVTTGYGVYQTGASDQNYFAGNVGIGKTPSGPLDVNGGIITEGTNAGFQFYARDGAAPTQWIWYATGGYARLWCSPGGDQIFVSGSGSVGVGGTSSSKLYVANASNYVPQSNVSSAILTSGGYGGGILMLDGSTYLGMFSNYGNLQFFAGGTASGTPGASSTGQMTILTTGRVGINQSNPQAQFHVVGPTNNPNLSADTEAVYFAYSSSVGLAFGSYNGTPNYNPWIQTKRSPNNGVADGLNINPLGGNVGINDANPNTTLTLGTALAPIKLATYNAGACYGIGVQSNILTFGASIDPNSGTPQMVLTNGGVLSIGSTGPPSGPLLYVNGNIRSTAEVESSNPTAFRAVYGNYGAIWYNDGGNYYLLFTNSGDQYGSFNGLRPFYANLSNGYVTLGQGANISNGLTVPNGATINGGLTANNGIWANQIGIGQTSTPYLLQLFQDSAAKPNGGSWINPSDSRLKRNIRDLVGGLDIIKRLRPIEAEYNGLHNLPEGSRVLGFLAEEIREILPGTVGSHRGKLRETDEEETDILDFNLHEVLIHLVLAVKQLAAMVSPEKTVA